MRNARSFEGKTVLVTGGAGFIGSHFIRYLFRHHPTVRIINLDKLTYAGNLENLRDVEGEPGYEFVRGDIKDRDLTADLMKNVQGVIHFAAETHVDRSIANVEDFLQTDLIGTFVLLEALKKAPRVEFFLHISTDEVYGSRREGSSKEDDPFFPSSPYAASKTAAEGLAYSYHKTYGHPVIILRPSNNFGPYQHPEKFIPLFVIGALEDRNLPLYGEGANIRDWLYVEDGCRAVETVALFGNIGEAYNAGGGNELTNKGVAERIVKTLGKPPDLIRKVPDRPGHDFRYSLDSRKIGGLGWTPKVPFDKALEKTIHWYRTNRDWWSTIEKKKSMPQVS